MVFSTLPMAMFGVSAETQDYYLLFDGSVYDGVSQSNIVPSKKSESVPVMTSDGNALKFGYYSQPNYNNSGSMKFPLDTSALSETTDVKAYAMWVNFSEVGIGKMDSGIGKNIELKYTNIVEECENVVVSVLFGSLGHTYAVRKEINYVVTGTYYVPASQLEYVDNGRGVTITKYFGICGIVVLPETIDGKPVTSIGAYAFVADGAVNDKTITQLVLPESLTSLEPNACRGLSACTEIYIPTSVKTISSRAFMNCSNLETVKISELTVVDELAFIGCNSVEFVYYDASINTVEEVRDALISGGDTVLGSNISLSDEKIVMNGGTLDGNGYTIDASKVANHNDCAITTTGGKVSNITIIGNANNTRILGSGSTGDFVLEENLYIDKVVIDKNLYALNGSGKTGAESVYVTNSTIYGWSTFSNIALFSFRNCTLGMGNAYDGYIGIYGDTEFTNCRFSGVFDLGAREDTAGATVTLNNCYYNGVRVTAENFVKYFYYGAGDYRDFSKLMTNNTVIVDGVVVENSGY